MLIEVDFDSDEAIYIQLCNQIIMGIATSVIREGDSLPSVRQLADMIGVNMHTVNKAYSVLKREGYISLDKRRGAVIALDIDKLEQLEEMRRELQIVLARGVCKNISRQHTITRIIGGVYAYFIYRTGRAGNQIRFKEGKGDAASVYRDGTSPAGAPVRIFRGRGTDPGPERGGGKGCAPAYG